MNALLSSHIIIQWFLIWQLKLFCLDKWVELSPTVGTARIISSGRIFFYYLFKLYLLNFSRCSGLNVNCSSHLRLVLGYLVPRCWFRFWKVVESLRSRYSWRAGFGNYRGPVLALAVLSHLRNEILGCKRSHTTDFCCRRWSHPPPCLRDCEKLYPTHCDPEWAFPEWSHFLRYTVTVTRKGTNRP